MFIFDVVNGICLVTPTIHDTAIHIQLKSSWHSERNISKCWGTWNDFAFFMLRSACNAGIVYMQCICELRAYQGDNSSLPAGLRSPVCHSIFPILRCKHSPMLGQSSKGLISCLFLFFFLKQSKNQASPWRGACLLKASLTALSASLPIFLLSKWLQFEFCHRKIHFPSVVLSRLYHIHMPVKW